VVSALATTPERQKSRPPSSHQQRQQPTRPQCRISTVQRVTQSTTKRNQNDGAKTMYENVNSNKMRDNQSKKQDNEFKAPSIKRVLQDNRAFADVRNKELTMTTAIHPRERREKRRSS
jgi:hypothetical protein